MDAVREYLSSPANYLDENLNLKDMSNAEYLVYVVGEKMKKNPRTSSLVEFQKMAGEQPDLKVDGKITIDVLLKKVEADDKDNK